MPVSFRSSRVRAAVLALTCAFLVALGVVPAMARHVTRHSRAFVPSGEVVVYGPINATTPTGASTTTVEQFNLPPIDSARAYYLKVQNGASNGTLRVTSGSVSLNGSVVVTSAELTAMANGATLTKSLGQINETGNVLSATVAGPAGAKLTLTIVSVVDPTFPTWGHVYTRPQGAQVTETFQFTVEAGGGAPYYLVIKNGVTTGGAPDSTAAVTSATITVNGVQVVGSTDLSSTTYSLTKPVALNQTAVNTVSVKLGGTAGSRMLLQFYVTDVAPPEYYQILAKGLSVTPPVVTRDSTVRVTVGVHDRTMPRVSVIGYPVMEFVGGSYVYAATLPLAQEGPKTFQIHAVDAAANARDTSITVIRDTQAPAVQVTSLPDTAFVTVDSAVVVAGTITDATAVTANLNGAALTINPTTHAFSTTAQLQAGVNFLTIAATDAAGNATTVVRQVTRETVPPSLTLTAPAESLYTKVATVRVSGSVSGGTNTKVTVTGGSGWTVLSNGTTFYADVGLVEGSNLITVTAKSASGAQVTRTRTIFLDTQAPVLTVAGPVEGLVIKEGSLAVTGTLSDQSRTALTMTIGSDVTQNGDSRGSFALQPTLQSEGPITISLKAEDAAGNVTVVDRHIVRDVTAPTIVLTTPASGATSRTSAYHVTGTVSDATALAVTVNGTSTAVGAGGAFDAVVTLGDGATAITVIATDAAGNQSQATGSVLLDAAPPVLTLTSPAVTLTVTNSATVTVTGTATDQTGASVLVNGVAATLDGAGAFSVPITLAEGTNTITIITSDGAGNSTTVVRQIDLDTQAPVLDVSSPQDGALAQGGTVSVSGTVTDAHAATVTANGTALDVGAGGTFSSSIAEPSDRIVTIVAADAAGNAATVTRTLGQTSPGGSLPPDPRTVAPALDRTVATTLAASTAFLYSGVNPIQTGVAPGAITPYQAAVVRGRLITREGAPLSGVKVSVLGRPELGQTLSREDGAYDLAVNGGEVMTFSYTKTGLLTSQRQVLVPRRDWVGVDPVAMIATDTVVTTIDPTQPISVARGSVMTDASGSRRATLMFEQGTDATMVMPDGSTRPVTALAVRATEYTVGPTGLAAMPGELPPSSAYTYAAEFSVDEAQAAGAASVQFSKPVAVYVENFIGFAVGGIVPVATYDRARATWVPEKNGRVVQVLSVSGSVATLDVDGSGNAASAEALLALGITNDELGQVASLYEPGQTLWRVRLNHFTPADFNWGPGPSGKDRTPKQRKAKHNDDPDCQNTKTGSIIGCERRTLGEMVPVTGTDLTLVYSSERTAGYRSDYSFDVALTDSVSSAVLAVMDKVLMRVTVAGRTTVDTFPVQAGLHARATWDGRDAYGRIVQGQQWMKIEVGYLYTQYAYYYGEPEDGPPASFGTVNGQSTNLPTRFPVTLWQNVLSRRVGTWSDASAGLGGWSISTHHSYDPNAAALYLGTGERRRGGNLNPTLEFAASGTGYDMLVNPDGSILLADGTQIFRIARDGTRTLFAGRGPGYSGDGGPATEALMAADRIARGPDGSIYVSGRNQMRLRRIDPQGIITTVAGNGSCGDSGDGLPASQAQFCTFDAVAFGRDGSLYVASGPDPYQPNRVRRIGPDGLVSHFAGLTGYSCSYTFCGDYYEGMPAASAALGIVADLAVLANGNVLIADGSAGAAVIWQVDPSGIRTRYAGGNGFADEGDGGPARDASFGGIWRIVAAPDGGVYVATQQEVIRQITPDGAVKTVAGKGSGNSCGGSSAPPCPPRGANALQVPLPVVYAIAVSAENALYINDANQQTTWKLTNPLPDLDATRATVSYVASEDGSLLYGFDEAGRHLSTRDALTGVAVQRFTYDAAGRLATLVDGNGNATSVVRDANGAPQEIVSPYGQRTRLTLDPGGRIKTVRAPGGEMVAFAYDSLGLMQSRLDPGGAEHRFVYDSTGLLVSDRNPDGFTQTLSAERTTLGQRVTIVSGTSLTTGHLTEKLPEGSTVRSITDEAGLTTTTTMYAADSTQIISPDGTRTTSTSTADKIFGMQSPMTTTSIRLPSGLTRTVRSTRSSTLSIPNDPLSVITRVDSTVDNGVVSTSTYVAAARTVTARSAEGRTSVTTLDSLGRVVASATGGLASTNITYDERGRVHEVIDAGRLTRLDYDGQGRLASIIDPSGARTQLTRDSVGRVLSVRDTGATIGFTYDSAGHLQTLTPAGKPAHAFRYTPGGLLREYEAPSVPGVSSTITRYRYDADQQLRAVVRPAGDSVTFDYDSAGRPLTVRTADDTTIFSFGATSGRLTSVASTDGGTYSLGYDGSLLTSATLSGGPVTGNVSYGYDSFLRPLAVAVNGDTVALQYDRDGLLRAAGALTITRNAVTGLPDSTTLDAVQTAYRYDSTGTIVGATTRANGAVLYDYTLERDALARIKRKTETVGSVTTDTWFAYDSVGRLSTVTRDGSTVAAYEYDANGNRVRRTTAAGTETGVVDAQDRLTSYAGAQYRYTDAGELQLRIVGTDTTQYHYDAAGALRWVRLPNGSRIDYVIDPIGRRIGKRVDGVVTQGFLYDSDLRIAAEFAPSGAVRSRFIYGSSTNVPEYAVRDGKRYRLITDHLGSVRLVVDAVSGVVVQQVDYDEYGRVLSNSAPGLQPFGYAGGILDDVTGLTRFGARDYDATSGRWTTKDPTGFQGSFGNVYSYGEGDPLRITDPSGLTTYVACRQVFGSGGHGLVAHCAVRVRDTERSLDQTIELAPDAKFNKVVKWKGPWDSDVDKYDSGGWAPVNSPCGISDIDFDDRVLKSAYNQTVRQQGAPYSFGGNNNSNKFVYDIITGAGGSVPGGVDRSFTFGAPGIEGH